VGNAIWAKNVFTVEGKQSCNNRTNEKKEIRSNASTTLSRQAGILACCLLELNAHIQSTEML